MIKAITKSIFGSANDRYVKSLGKIVNQINALEPQIQALSDEELKAQTDKFRSMLADGATLDDILPEAFATVREASVRVLGMRHFDVQMIGGIVLHRGEIAEMRRMLDTEKPPENVYDVKRAPGGLIDIEFIAQYLALTGGLKDGPFENPTSTIDLIDHADPEVIDADAANTLKTAYGLYNTVLQIQRVCLDGAFDPDEEGLSGFVSLLCEQTGHPALAALEQELEAVQQSVRAIFKNCIG